MKCVVDASNQSFKQAELTIERVIDFPRDSDSELTSWQSSVPSNIYVDNGCSDAVLSNAAIFHLIRFFHSFRNVLFCVGSGRVRCFLMNVEKSKRLSLFVR